MSRLDILVALSLLVGYGLTADDGEAKVLQYDFQRGNDAQYSYSFETSNGIKRNETGEDIPSIHDATNNAALVKGSFTYPGADGVIYSVNYVADEAGFHPEGEHLRIPPFTPWIPGQPIDDGQYKEDKSGKYTPDNSGKYTPEIGENEQSPVLEPKENQVNHISGERILNAFQTTSPQPPTSVTQKYLPTQPKYISGESILDTFLTAKKLPPSPSVTPKYLPSSSTISNSYTSGENILNAFRESSRPTPKYLPSEANNIVPTESPLQNDIIRKAFYNKPTPHPDILLHSTPVDGLKSRFFGVGADATQNKLAYVKFAGKPQNNEAKRGTGREVRSFQYTDINPELRLLAGLI